MRAACKPKNNIIIIIIIITTTLWPLFNVPRKTTSKYNFQVVKIKVSYLPSA